MNENIALIGSVDNKRTEYFLKAGKELNLRVKFYEIDKILPDFLMKTFIKIDPPKYKEFEILKGYEKLENYIKFLKNIDSRDNIVFLNEPNAILNVLNKKVCKKILLNNNIATTPMLDDNITDIKGLRKLLLDKKVRNVFIKPKYGSGAAGIIAYRINFKKNEEIIYTSIKNYNGKWVNTKKIEKISGREKIEEIVNFVLYNEHIIEKWIPKSKLKDISYDLRVVYQFGKIVFMVARGSKSPVTNLHLNNQAISIEDLNLSQETIYKISNLCERAMKCFKGLNYAGIDILLKGRNLEPIIIEINGQGDLIYKDIFEENNIYKEQIIRMVNNEI